MKQSKVSTETVKRPKMTSSKKTAIFHQILTVFPMYVLSFATGLVMGWLPIALYYLRSSSSSSLSPLAEREQDADVITLTAEQGAWMASAQSFGRLFSAVPAGIITDVIGRRPVTVTAGIVYTIVWSLIPFAKSFALLSVLNFLLGIGVGLVNVANHMHMSEIVAAEYRGSFHAVSGFSYNFGLLVVSTAGVYLSYSSVCFINAFISFVYVIVSYRLTIESPYYLFAKGDYRTAERNLKWLRTGLSSDELEREITSIKTNIEKQFNNNDNNNNNNNNNDDDVNNHNINRGIIRNIAKPLLADPINRRCLYVVLSLNFFIVLTGSVSIKLNSTFIFGDNSFVHNRAEYQLIVSRVQFVSSFFSTFVIERFARRTLFIGASLLNGFILSTTAVLFSTGFVTVRFVLVLIYYVCYTLTLHNLVNMLRCEILPQNVKAIGTGLAVLVQSASTGLSILLFQYVLEATDGSDSDNVNNVSWNFVLFAVSSFGTAIIVYRYLPEVKGKPLAEVYDNMRDRIIKRSEPS